MKKIESLFATRNLALEKLESLESEFESKLRETFNKFNDFYEENEISPYNSSWDYYLDGFKEGVGKYSLLSGVSLEDAKNVYEDFDKHINDIIKRLYSDIDDDYTDESCDNYLYAYWKESFLLGFGTALNKNKQ